MECLYFKLSPSDTLPDTGIVVSKESDEHKAGQRAVSAFFMPLSLSPFPPLSALLSCASIDASSARFRRLIQGCLLAGSNSESAVLVSRARWNSLVNESLGKQAGRRRNRSLIKANVMDHPLLVASHDGLSVGRDSTASDVNVSCRRC